MGELPRRVAAGNSSFCAAFANAAGAGDGEGEAKAGSTGEVAGAVEEIALGVAVGDVLACNIFIEMGTGAPCGLWGLGYLDK